ncbi:hypothetical protein QT196_00280 [Streptomyces sp. P9-2B-2]|uniref:hypothetical protein n=1 Tax=Streptomyces sp. P9-2B-2 TaxID=3057114 RepID=UPI0025B3F88F|nr:hypothetical protein [Streptomyces sp. P9-2B-2]WJY35839.1 hypothetical protein QT196_00280 [Streptomyces sp. P9-2B-2]
MVPISARPAEDEDRKAPTDRAPCKTKVRKPPSPAALAEAERLREGPATGSSAERVVIDLTHYAAVVERLRSVPSPKQEESPE